MRRLTILLLSVVAFVGFNSGAEAATKRIYKAKPVYKAPKVAPSLASSGFYVGINGGYGWGHTAFSSPLGTSNFRHDGGLIGLTFGYNAQLGAIVYGLETDIAYSWIKGTNDGIAPCPGCEVRLRHLGTLRGRLGYALGKTLPYVTGGLAYGGFRTLTPVGSDYEHKAGWTVGGGIEYAVSGPWSVKLEYLYVDLARGACNAPICGPETDVKLRTNVLRLGTNYRF